MGSYEKIFETKILVPWDTPRVPGVLVLGPRDPRVSLTSNSSYFGCLGLLWTIVLRDSSQLGKPDCADFILFPFFEKRQNH